jgi:hypothetical protein
MTHTCLHSQFLTRLAFLLVGALLVAGHSTAQTSEVQIMVNGSWDYVEDPNPGKDPNSAGRNLDRIVIVAPQTHSHGAFVFSGNDASKFLNMSVMPPQPIYRQLATGIYYLDIANLAPKSGHKLTSTDLNPSNYINAQFVRIGKISAVLYEPDAEKPRVAISLPEPDYYSTYSGKRSFSESKVDTKPIVHQKPHKYTTWMVLHYWVNSSATSATLTAILDDQSAFSTPPLMFHNDFGSSIPPGISVVMGAAYGANNRCCDTFSKDSFDHSSTLWGLTRYAQFPEEDMTGNQHRAYHSKCDCRQPLSAGSADCHMAQMSINGIVPQ